MNLGKGKMEKIGEMGKQGKSGNKTASPISPISPIFPIFLLFLLLLSCSPFRYIAVDTQNPAAITFPPELRRILVVNNAVTQQEVPYESTLRMIPDSVKITADSTAFDFCRTLGEIVAEHPFFDDVRLLEGCFRKDMMPLTAMFLTREEVGQLCDEHEVDVVISLDRLLFKLKEDTEKVYGVEVIGMLRVEVSGVLRLYLPGRETPMTTVLLADTIKPDFWFEPDDMLPHSLLFSSDHTNLLRKSARLLAEEARVHFIPYWSHDVRWYYVASESQWKEATAFAVSERWDRATQLWLTLYDRASSWKKRARLASNIALGKELTGDLEEALKYAERSHQLFLEQLGKEDETVKKQEVYVRVLSNRIVEERRLRVQMGE